MADQTIGTARIEIEIDNSKVEPGVNRAKQSVSSLTTEVEQGSQRQVQATKRQTQSWERQIAVLGKTREETLRWKIAQGTSASEAARLTALLDKQVASMKTAATASGQYRAALRSLPAQGTDIVTQIAGGQNLGLVLLQQGGQIRDQFGSASLAIRSVGTALAGLVNPVTLTVGAVAALALAWKAASEEQQAFQSALILTGDYAGKSVTDLQALTVQLDKLEGVTRGGATDAVRAVAESGRFAGQQFDQVAAAAARMEASTGQAVDTTIERFKDIANDPVKALLKLNQAEHFLTQAQVDRVRQLEEEGRAQDAASEGISIYADHLDEVARRSEAALPATTQLWRQATDYASQLVGEVKTYADLLVRISSLRLGVSGVKGLTDYLPPSFLEQLQFINSVGRKALDRMDPAGASTAGRARHSPGRTAADSIVDSVEIERQMKLEDQWTQVTQQNLTKQQRKLEEINKVKKLGADLGLSQVEIDKQIAAIDERYAERGAKKKEQLTDEQKAAKQLQQTYESITDQLERQVTLAGDRSNYSRVQYEIANGSLRGLDTTKQADLLNLAQVTDAVNDYVAIYGDGYDNIVHKTAESKDAMTEFARQAARNSQDAFADFLFDPFSDGIDGMVEGFGKALQRMAANAAASKVFEVVGGWATGYQGGGASIINAIGSAITTKNAKGGVYASPDLSKYSSSIVHQPTTFAFARGAGLMGEAGPEAIMPLTRASNGRLGVQAVGGGSEKVAVEINNYGGGSVSARQKTTTMPDGTQLRKIVLTIVGESMNGGELAELGKSRFGWQESI